MSGTVPILGLSPPGLPRRLGVILDELRRHLAIRAAKDRAFAVLVLILWNRLSRIAARVSTIVLRHQAGTLRTTRAKPTRRANPVPPPPDKLPRQRGWLIRRAPECNAHGEYLRLLLEDPETRALLAAAPQLRPLLRPLWRMLRLDPVPDALRTEPAAPPRSRIRRPRPHRPRPARPATPRRAPPDTRAMLHPLKRG